LRLLLWLWAAKFRPRRDRSKPLRIAADFTQITGGHRTFATSYEYWAIMLSSTRAHVTGPSRDGLRLRIEEFAVAKANVRLKWSGFDIADVTLEAAGAILLDRHRRKVYADNMMPGLGEICCIDAGTAADVENSQLGRRRNFVAQMRTAP
jgi:hypothetical protein